MWCVVKVGGRRGGVGGRGVCVGRGASTSLDVNGLKRVVGEFKVAGTARKRASGFDRLLRPRVLFVSYSLVGCLRELFVTPIHPLPTLPPPPTPWQRE